MEHRKIKAGDSGRNLRIYEKMEREGEWFDSRALYYYGRELYFHGSIRKEDAFWNRFWNVLTAGWKTELTLPASLPDACMGWGEEEEALRALLRALEYDVPRGETCCDLGRHFQDREKYEQAVYWYKQAFTAKKDLTSAHSYGRNVTGSFRPSLCASAMTGWEIGRRRSSIMNLLEKYQPDSEYYLANKKYFDCGNNE